VRFSTPAAPSRRRSLCLAVGVCRAREAGRRRRRSGARARPPRQCPRAVSGAPRCTTARPSISPTLLFATDTAAVWRLARSFCRLRHCRIHAMPLLVHPVRDSMRCLRYWIAPCGREGFFPKPGRDSADGDRSQRCPDSRRGSGWCRIPHCTSSISGHLATKAVPWRRST
jgi:hypothetical protein